MANFRDMCNFSALLKARIENIVLFFFFFWLKNKT
jgi:hypothetical protein